MDNRMSKPEKPPSELSADDMRQGQIILNTPLRILIFTGALGIMAGLVLVLLSSFK
jgi:hypothetical protein